MIQVSIEVRSGAARFKVAVQAESIERAVEIAKRYHPGNECRVTFPIASEAFFVGRRREYARDAGRKEVGAAIPSGRNFTGLWPFF